MDRLLGASSHGPGALALQINEGNAKLVRLPDAPAAESVSSKTIEVNLEADGKATIDLRAEVTGVSAPGFRERYHATSTRKARLQEDLSQEVPGLEVAAVEANDLLNLEEKVSPRVRGKSSIVGKREGDRLSLGVGPRESMVRDYGSALAALDGFQVARPLDHRTSLEGEAAAGHEGGRPAGGQSGTTPFGSYRLRVEQTGNVVSVSTTVTLDKSRIKASEYGAFRTFCRERRLRARSTARARPMTFRAASPLAPPAARSCRAASCSTSPFCDARRATAPGLMAWR